MQNARKYIVLLVVVGSLVAADQWTKRWARDNLASYDHPLPLVVRAGEAGQTLGQLVAARFPDLAENVDAVVRQTVRETEASPAPLDPSLNPFASVGRPGGLRPPARYHAYAHGDLSRPPRVVDNRLKDLSERWLFHMMTDSPREETRQLSESAFADMRLDEYLAERVPELDLVGVRRALERGHVVAVPHSRPPESPQRVVAEGERFLLYERIVDVIPSFLRFEYKENPGAAWGLMSTASPVFRRLFLAGVSLLASIVVLVIFVRLQRGHWSAVVAFSLILSGAVGNLIDRVETGLVIDFVDMYVKRAHWPTYNIADVAITLGVVALVIEMLFVKSSPFATQSGKKKARA